MCVWRLQNAQPSGGSTCSTTDQKDVFGFDGRISPVTPRWCRHLGDGKQAQQRFATEVPEQSDASEADTGNLQSCYF